MLIRLFILSVFMVVLVMVSLGIKMLFDRNSGGLSHSCKMEDGDNNSCSGCGLKEISSCKETLTK